ncbi:MAG: UDP-N-acetylmuramate--L-alanine ligase, partial [bacterium]|nr:UDP-N-acetylmuramate--L-alanine ligase [bacterium]
MFKKYQHIHFVGIGGIGMSGIAEVLLNLGYHVSGSDIKSSAVTRRLKKRGAKIFTGHDKDHLNGTQVLVTSSAVKETNPEVRQAKMMNVPVVPRAEMLAELMRMKYGIAVAGTHGKTTTTSMIGAVLQEAGLDPTLIIGGKVNSFKSNARLGKGEFLVAEADESDRSFLRLGPTIAVITNIDPEHMENYKNFNEVKKCFVDFANKVPFYGAVVACADHPVLRKIFPELKRRLVTYGVAREAEYTAKNIEEKEKTMSFDVCYHGECLGRIKMEQPGRHHVGNALAAVAAAREIGVPF